MSLSPEDERERTFARYNWFAPDEAGRRMGGMSSRTVIDRIKNGHIPAEHVVDVSRGGGGKGRRYRISPEGIASYNRESQRRIERLQESARRP